MTAVSRPKSSVTLKDFFDPSKPWVLGHGNGAPELGAFLNHVPRHYRQGPWHVATYCSLLGVVCLLYYGASWMLSNPPNEDGWMSLFEIDEKEYQPFTFDWFVTLAVFLWMFYVTYDIFFLSPLGKIVMITFTLWSWTTVTIRHGLIVLAPWIPMVRVPAEVLRLPALLSASITTGVWNFVLFPAIVFYYIKDAEQRKKFIAYFTNFRLTQLHVFNIFYAVTNGAYFQPLRPLHLGDLAAVATMMVLYMVHYLCILDRLEIHLYPIFSPRTPLVTPSLALIVAICVGGYVFWKGYLPEA